MKMHLSLRCVSEPRLWALLALSHSMALQELSTGHLDDQRTASHAAAVQSSRLQTASPAPLPGPSPAAAQLHGLPCGSGAAQLASTIQGLLITHQNTSACQPSAELSRLLAAACDSLACKRELCGGTGQVQAGRQQSSRSHVGRESYIAWPPSCLRLRWQDCSWVLRPGSLDWACEDPRGVRSDLPLWEPTWLWGASPGRSCLRYFGPVSGHIAAHVAQHLLAAQACRSYIMPHKGSSAHPCRLTRPCSAEEHLIRHPASGQQWHAVPGQRLLATSVGHCSTPRRLQQ